MGNSGIPYRAIIVWLLTGCVMIATMVVIGGITRLTHSGLSMVNWDPIMGTIPPMDEEEWQEAFEQYKQFPEYQKRNPGMSLSGFKSIFFWEYLHRMWGRLMGLVFLIPFGIFYLRGFLNAALLKKCLIILAGGALVGGLGWFMVVSGLKDHPDVSHYRLAIHLVGAFLLFGYILWVALDLGRGERKGTDPSVKGVRRWTDLLLGLILIQVVYGAFVAGLDGGLMYNTFPGMGKWWVPGLFYKGQDLLVDLTSTGAGVQFIHRMLAYLIVLLTGGLFVKGIGKLSDRTSKMALYGVLLAVILQFLLGVLTLLMVVPLTLGVLHQLGALLLFAAGINLRHALSLDHGPVTDHRLASDTPRGETIR